MPSSSPFISHIRLAAPVVAAINHLLAQEAWARDALALHAGKLAVIDTGSFAVALRVTRDGMLESVASEQEANVTLRVKLADLPLIVQNRERAFSYVKIEGDAGFANTISQLSRVLRWEAEHELEPWIGPLAATRLAGGVRNAAGSARATGRKLAEQLSEYFLEEQPLLVRPAMLEEFSGEVSRLRDDVERSAKRIDRLEHMLARHAAAVETTTRTNGQQPVDD